MEADLILLDKNPAENISNIQFIDRVFLKGKIAYSQKPIQSFDIPDYTYPEGLVSAEYVSTDGTQRRVINYDRYESEQIITQTTYKNGEKWAEEEFTLERSLSATKWAYSRPSDNTELNAVKENGVIKMTGSFKGKPQDKSFQIGDGLWGS